MNRLVKLLVIGLIAMLSATLVSADVWYWIDAQGNKHFVDSNRSIWTWTDETGKAFYSDKPDHEDAVRVQLFWHSDGTLEEVDAAGGPGQAGAVPVGSAYPGETAEERSERETVVSRNCKRAREILESYRNAPKLYRTDGEGRRVILTDEEYAATLADAHAKTEFLCNQ